MTSSVVLDTNVWLDVLLFEDPRCRALAAAVLSGGVRAVTDAATDAEFARVLHYPQLRLDETGREDLLHRYRALARPCIDTAPLPALPRCADVDDQKFLEVAARAGARWLVSRDLDVLALGARVRRAGLFDIVTPWNWSPDP